MKSGIAGKLGYFLLVAGLAAGTAQAQYRMQIAFPGYTGRSETLADFPVLVVLSNGVDGSNFDFGTTPFLSTQGYDLRFRDATDATDLDYEIERWDANAACYVWVRVPSLPPDGSGYIWAKWGDPSASGQLPCTTNGATWDHAYVGVWHMNDATATTVAESTSNKRTGTKTSAGNPLEADGVVGKGQDFSSDRIGYPSVAQTLITIEAWGRMDTKGISNFPRVMESPGYAVYPMYSVAGRPLRFMARRGTTGYWDTTSKFDLNANYHVAVAYDASSTANNPVIYINGEAQTITRSTAPAGTPTSNAGTGYWGNSSAADRPWDGILDEARISNVLRTEDWAWASFMSQGSNMVFCAYGNVEALNANEPSIATLPAAVLGENQALLNGLLVSTGTTATTVSVYWGPGGDQGEEGPWAFTNAFGVYQPALGDLPCAYATNVTGLTPGQPYTYRYFAANTAGGYWGLPESFTTWLAPSTPTVAAAEDVIWVRTTLKGAIAGGIPDPQAWFCLNAGGDPGAGDTNDWDRLVPLGAQSGAFSNRVTGLLPETTYYCRVYVANEAGEAWSANTVSFTTLAQPTTLTIDGDQKVDGAGAELRFVATDATLPRDEEGTFDFGTLGAQPIALNLNTNLLYGSENDGVQQTMTIDMNGGGIAGTNATAIRTFIVAGANRHSDHVVLTNVALVAMGGIDTHADNVAGNYPRAGNVTIGAPDKPAGNVRTDYIHTMSGTGTRLPGSIGYAFPGSVAIHGSGDVLIQNADGTERGDILTMVMREARAGTVTVSHQGSFAARDILTFAYCQQNAAGYGGHVTLVGNAINATPSGALAVNEIDASYTRDTPNYGNRAGDISISGYTSVTTGVLSAYFTGKSSGLAGDISITDIAGDIAVGGPVDVEVRQATSKNNDGILSLFTRVGSGGKVTLAELDLNKVRYAALYSDGGPSHVTGVLTNFDTTYTGGSGTVADPYVTTQADLRAEPGQKIYYAYEAGVLNDYLGGAVYQVRNLADNGAGGLLLAAPPLKAPGTVITVR